jgi:hypothetical protein
MFPRLRREAALILLCSVVFVGYVVPGGLRAEEKKTVRLSFAPVDTIVHHYKAMSQLDQNYGGTDVRMNQTFDVDMVFMKKTEEGDYKIRLKFNKVTSSVLQGTQLVEWEPPLKLEGGFIEASISPRDEVVAVVPGGAIQSVRNTDQLKDAIDPWFIDLPDTTVAVGGTWTKEVVKGKKDEGEPDVEGVATYTLKKIEKKGDIEVATIEGKVKLKLNQPTGAGILVADGDGTIKASLAVAGCYIVECKQTMEIRGNTIVKDPLTDKETKNETAVTQYMECKLQQ